MLAALLFGMAGFIADYYRNREILQVIQAISFLFVINSLNNVHNALLYKKLEIKITRLSTLASVFISGMVGVTIAYFGGGIWSLVVSTYVASIVPVVIIWSYSKWRPSFMFSWSDIRSLMPMGIRVFLTNYLDAIFSRLDVLVIGRIFSPAILGYYFRAQSLNQMVTKYSSQGLSGVFFPSVSRMEGDKIKIAEFYNKAMNAVCMLSFFITGFLYVVAEPLVVILFGEKWLPSVDYFKILAFSSFVFPLTLIFNGVLLGTGKAGKMFKLELIRKIANALGLLIGMYFGLEIYLWVLVVTNIFGLFVSFVYIKNVLDLQIITNSVLVFKYVSPLFVGIFGVFTLQFFYQSGGLYGTLFINGILFSIAYIFFSYIAKFQGYITLSNIVGRYTNQFLKL